MCQPGFVIFRLFQLCWQWIRTQASPTVAIVPLPSSVDTNLQLWLFFQKRSLKLVRPRSWELENGAKRILIGRKNLVIWKSGNNYHPIRGGIYWLSLERRGGPQLGSLCERSNQQILSSERRDLQNEFKNRSKNRLGKKVQNCCFIHFGHFADQRWAVLKGTLACTVIPLNVLFGKS